VLKSSDTRRVKESLSETLQIVPFPLCYNSRYVHWASWPSTARCFRAQLLVEDEAWEQFSILYVSSKHNSYSIHSWITSTFLQHRSQFSSLASIQSQMLHHHAQMIETPVLLRHTFLVGSHKPRQAKRTFLERQIGIRRQLFLCLWLCMLCSFLISESHLIDNQDQGETHT